MKITSLTASNYRTLEAITVRFPPTYAAICGRNDAGKTNLVRAIRAVVGKSRRAYDLLRGDVGVSFKDDFPKWKAPTEAGSPNICIEATFEFDSSRDAGLYRFITQHLRLTDAQNILTANIKLEHGNEKASAPRVTIEVGAHTFTGMEAEEVLRRVRAANCVVFHNSTELNPIFRIFGTASDGGSDAILGQYSEILKGAADDLNRRLRKATKEHQRELQGWLGRLGSKYKLSMTVPSIDVDFFPLGISLGHNNYDVPLDSWGSGTRNRTLILLALFRAKQIASGEESTEKVTPVLVVEEPESFLHPSAQAEFGRVLADLSEEFDVQVIVTTHSPYLLSTAKSASNILVNRKSHHRQLLGTQTLDSNDEQWFKPFGEVLGLGGEELKPWRNLMLSGNEAVLLVEGAIDKAYFDLLREEQHGPKRLIFDGEVLPYDGTGALQNTVLLRFVKNRYRKVFVTFDLDSKETIEKTMLALGMERGLDYCPIGLSKPGRRNIEGLLPESVSTTVYAGNPGLVQAATNGTKDEQKSARNTIKQLLFEEFKRAAHPGEEDYGEFYKVVKVINQAFAEDGRRISEVAS